MKIYTRYAICVLSFLWLTHSANKPSPIDDDLNEKTNNSAVKSTEGDRVQRVKGLFGRLFGRRSSGNREETKPAEEYKPVPKVVPLSRASAGTESTKTIKSSLRTANTQVMQKVQMEAGFEDGFMESETLIPSPSVVRVSPKASEPVKSAVSDVSTAARQQPNVPSGEYVVRPGDSLLLIARNLYQDPSKWTMIRDLNGLTSNVLQVGQRLKLPSTALVARPLSTEDSSASSRMEAAYIEATRLEDLFPADRYRFKIYRVGTGDTLSSIASKEMGSARLAPNLGRFNDIAPNGYLIAGQSLVVPIRKE